jgi:hypothetical protein
MIFSAPTRTILLSIQNMLEKSNVKTVKEQTFHKRPTNVPQTFRHLTRNETKMSEFVPKSASSKEHISI